VFLFPGLFLGAWPTLPGGVRSRGCLLAWWQPDPTVRLAGSVLATASAIVLLLFGQFAVAVETACLFGECPPGSVFRWAGVRAPVIGVGAALVPAAGWVTRTGRPGGWAWGILCVVVVLWGLYVAAGVGGLFG
jgi:hypothetical protein